MTHATVCYLYLLFIANSDDTLPAYILLAPQISQLCSLYLKTSVFFNSMYGLIEVVALNIIIILLSYG
jgi:hypothetical protein